MTTLERSQLDTIVTALSLDEKLAQLTGLMVPYLFDVSDGRSRIDPHLITALRPHGVGHLSLAWFAGHDRGSLRDGLATIQAAVREHTPFGIGALVHFEALSGVVHAAGPQFPTAWAQAAAWSPELVERAAAVSSAVMEDAGIHIAFSPVFDLARDPRWGRVHETYGEDPELVSELAVAFVRGMQGPAGEHPTLATGKHFLAYGVSEGGLNQAATALGRRALTDEHAEPFRRAITEAGLSVVMNSYNEIDGIPAAANHWLLTELLRGQLGFRGVVMSDYDSIGMLRSVYHTARTPAEAGGQAVTAGMDVDLPNGDNFSALAEEVRAGRLDERVIDRAVRRVLEIKSRLGLIPTVRPAAPTRRAVDLDEAADVRRAIAERAVVLLDNNGVLPLRADARIVVVGPADELRIHFGAYTSVANLEMQLGAQAMRSGEIEGIDPADAMFTDMFQARLPGMDPVFEKVAAEMHPDAETVLGALRRHAAQVRYQPLGELSGRAEPLDPDVVAAAVGDADVVVAVVGERTGWAGNNTAGEGQSTADPRLPGNQQQLVELLGASGVPTVTVVVSGRPLIMPSVVEASAATVLAPLLGEVAGPTVARVLFGEVNPSGHLPMTFPRCIGQVPMYHGHHYGSGNDHPTGIRHGYNDVVDQTPLFPFGHGLSYTTFDVELVRVRPVVPIDADIRARIRVRNTGPTGGETVVQLYARDEVATVVRPVRQLLAFRRVALAAGETSEFDVVVPAERLAFTGRDGLRFVEPGEVTLTVGLSAADIRATGRVRLIGKESAARAKEATTP